MQEILNDPAVRKAERALVSAISSLNLQTIKFLANDLGNGHAVNAHTWNDCPMTLAQKVGNTLMGKTNYMKRDNVAAFASAWDSYMSQVGLAANRASIPHDSEVRTNGFGVQQVRRIASTELAQRESSRFSRMKQSIIDKNTTECARETLSMQESEALLAAIMGTPQAPDQVINP